MKPFVTICINREYGSGGKTVAQMLSKELGIAYYDKEILKLASDESGINEALFAKADEDMRKSNLFRAAVEVYRGELINPDSRDFTSEKNLFNYQALVIKKLAQTENCILVGRCGNYILENEPNVVRIFIYADRDTRLKRAAEKKALQGKELEKYVDKINAARSEYYFRHTGEEWYDARHYDICLDSSQLSYEQCVGIIKAYVKERCPEMPELSKGEG